MSAISGKRENFPINTFRVAEQKIGELRCALLKKAAEIAERTSLPKEEIYTVTKEHINLALAELFCPQCLKLFS